MPSRTFVPPARYNHGAHARVLQGALGPVLERRVETRFARLYPNRVYSDHYSMIPIHFDTSSCINLCEMVLFVTGMFHIAM